MKGFNVIAGEKNGAVYYAPLSADCREFLAAKGEDFCIGMVRAVVAHGDNLNVNVDGVVVRVLLDDLNLLCD